jgi:PAS domain S-box-containing protein
VNLELQKIIKGLKNSSGQDFFDNMVLNLSEVLNVDYIFIAQINQENSKSKTISVSAKNSIVENFEYALKDTPCSNVADDDVCCYPEKIQSLFPNDQLLIDMGIESYIGAPLHNSQGKVLGRLVALSEKPIADDSLITTLFEIFASRIAVEMERTQQSKRINLFYQAMQDASDAMLISDKNNHIVEVNKAFETIFKVKAADIIGKNPNVLASGLQSSNYYDTMWESINAKGSWQGEIIDQTFDGEILPMLTSITALYDDDKNIENYLAVYNNLTEINAVQDQLRSQERLASMGEVLASITHQWKQPISIIQSLYLNSDMKEELGTHTIQSYKETSCEVRTQVNYMLQTITDFKNFLNPNREKKSFLLKDGIHAVSTLLDSQYKKDKLTFNLNIEVEKPVEGYYNEYMQVLINIINNARDAYSENELHNREILLRISAHDDLGIIEITDNAGGISDDIIHTIFDPYMTTKCEEKGTGIGLYMVKKIIENMHGSISVKSIGHSTTFTITLPLAKE